MQKYGLKSGEKTRKLSFLPKYPVQILTLFHAMSVLSFYYEPKTWRWKWWLSLKDTEKTVLEAKDIDGIQSSQNFDEDIMYLLNCYV